MKILDAGVYGVICPMINTPEEAEALVQACHANADLVVMADDRDGRGIEESGRDPRQRSAAQNLYFVAP